MKRSLIYAALLAAFFAPATQATVISIDDNNEFLTLMVALAAQPTALGAAAPGTGNVIDITTPTPSNGISDIHYSLTPERLSFTFSDHAPWNTDVTYFRYLTEAHGLYSDLFVIQGLRGQNPDYVTFISNDALTGNISTDIATFGLQLNPVATPFQDLGTIAEDGNWQLMMDTGPDQYYVRSNIPEPASLALVALALFGAAGATRRRS